MAWRESFGFYERLYAAIDFFAALFFVVGSVFFFFDDWHTLATFLFLIGSLLFAARPTAQVLREYRLAKAPLPEDPDD
ncbi:YrhK family protein [Algicella marina]|uniref:Cobalamin biosynthesis protein CobQ n=1 Tax=Algicella marina TaxID=2683284 RepID=A0A6P1T330_9RHOB|nr:YrhK family protein [Algicella marina]QHQ35719.1 cobalamin biosynthesis protein CobQ [Algicella marina]